MNQREAQRDGAAYGKALQNASVSYFVPCEFISAVAHPSALRLYFRPARMKEGGRVTSVEQVKARVNDLCLQAKIPRMFVEQESGYIRFEIPLEMPEQWTDSKTLNSIPVGSALIGVGVQGEAICLPIDYEHVAHILISGASGYGKTELLRTMAVSMARDNRAGTMFALFDRKPRNPDPFAHTLHKNLMFVARTPDEQLAGMREIVRIMDSRAIPAPPPRIIVLVVELADSCEVNGEEFISMVSRIARVGRELRVHLLCATQRPSSNEIPQPVRTNSAFIVLHTSNAGDARAATGRYENTGAEKLQLKGEAMFVGGGEPERFRVLRTKLPDVPAGWIPPAPPRITPSRAAPSAKSASLADVWAAASEDERRHLVAKHILANALKTGMKFNDERGGLTANSFFRLVAGRSAAGNLLASNLMQMYNAASSTNPSSTTLATPPPALNRGGDGAVVEVELAQKGGF